MIGYLKPFLKELPRELKNEYRAVYCGLCHTLKKIGGFVGTACLNYEAVLFLVILLAMQEEEPKVFHGSCPYTPFLHVPFVDYLSPLFINAACTSYVVVNLKVMDNLQDEKAFRWIAAERLLRRGTKRAEVTLKNTIRDLYGSVYNYYILEQDNSSTFNSLLEASGKMLETIVIPLFKATKVTNERELLFMANALGRWIYLMDACDDWLEDKRRDEFNPINFFDDISSIRSIVENTEACVKSYALKLPIKRYNRLVRLLLIDNLKKVSTQILAKLEREWQIYEC